jgi:hypothetical protein
MELLAWTCIRGCSVARVFAARSVYSIEWLRW